jgi:Zn-dependent peptidase ImmA (M78 family)
MPNNRLPVEIVTAYMGKVPVKVDELALALGLKLTYEDLPDDVSGKIERDEADGFVVTVNRNHPLVRQRFTIAHEIAHFVLHRDLIGDGVVDDGLYRSRTLSSAVERQANRYAADILMPWWQVTSRYRDGQRTAKEMAATFCVSVAVAEIRLKELAPALDGALTPV